MANRTSTQTFRMTPDEAKHLRTVAATKGLSATEYVVVSTAALAEVPGEALAFLNDLSKLTGVSLATMARYALETFATQEAARMEALVNPAIAHMANYRKPQEPA